MKYLTLYLAICLLFISLTIFAQAPQQAEVDLSKSFEKINYWFGKTHDGIPAQLPRTILYQMPMMFLQKNSNGTLRNSRLQ
jgi:hypothetical protein